MDIRILIGAFIACTLCFVVAAKAEAEEFDPFKDWISTATYLRANGVEPSNIGWLGIEQQCLGLKTERDQHAYNACKFDKAMNTIQHNEDKRQCYAQARGAYPTYIASQQADAVIRASTNGITRTTYLPAPVPYRDLVAMRSGTAAGCMQNLGWASAYDANLGKRY